MHCHRKNGRAIARRLVFFCITEKHASDGVVMQTVLFSGRSSAPETRLVDHMEGNARKQISSTRFGDRRKRIARRTERDNFKRIIMPVLYVIGILGVFAFCAAAIYAELADADIRPFLALAVGPPLLIGVMETFRLARGHHSDSLEEP
jgi:hypothetical protein